MSAIVNVANVSPPTTVLPKQPLPASLDAPPNHPQPADTIELSAFGRTLSRAVDESSLSLARTRAIRAEIEAGTFETSERIEGTVERLLRHIFG